MPTGTAFAIVDAFTAGRAFSGNPAGVLLLDEFPDVEWMQGVANELQQAETAFLAPSEDGAFQLRWFTPVAEVALCGHATLASAHWLWESGVLEQETAAFTTRSGRLTAVRATTASCSTSPRSRPRRWHRRQSSWPPSPAQFPCGPE